MILHQLWTGLGYAEAGVAFNGVIMLPTGVGEAETGHGLDSVVEVLGFIIGLINSDAQGQHSDLNTFGLELMTVALGSGGSGAAATPCHSQRQHVYRNCCILIALTSQMACCLETTLAVWHIPCHAQILGSHGQEHLSHTCCPCTLKLSFGTRLKNASGCLVVDRPVALWADKGQRTHAHGSGRH